jgi:hypothetical protein
MEGLGAELATPLGTGQYLETCHCTVSCTAANTGVCTGPYQPDQFTDRKTVFGGGLRLIYRWRRDLRAAANGFAQVLVAPAGDGVTAPLAMPAIEIELAGNARVRIPASVSPALAAAVVEALARRSALVPPGEGQQLPLRVRQPAPSRHLAEPGDCPSRHGFSTRLPGSLKPAEHQITSILLRSRSALTSDASPDWVRAGVTEPLLLRCREFLQTHPDHLDHGLRTGRVDSLGDPLFCHGENIIDILLAD